MKTRESTSPKHNKASLLSRVDLGSLYDETEEAEESPEQDRLFQRVEDRQVLASLPSATASAAHIGSAARIKDRAQNKRK